MCPSTRYSGRMSARFSGRISARYSGKMFVWEDILAEYLAAILEHNIADILVYLTWPWQITLWSTDCFALKSCDCIPGHSAVTPWLLIVEISKDDGSTRTITPWSPKTMRKTCPEYPRTCVAFLRAMGIRGFGCCIIERHLAVVTCLPVRGRCSDPDHHPLKLVFSWPKRTMPDCRVRPLENLHWVLDTFYLI